MDKLNDLLKEYSQDITVGDLDSLKVLRGFIKWLVENDKIDKSKVFSFIDTADKPYEDILCLLALSDEPISDLISFLK